LPSPRYKTYEENNYQAIQDKALGYFSPIVSGLGLFHYGTNYDLLEAMQGY